LTLPAGASAPAALLPGAGVALLAGGVPKGKAGLLTWVVSDSALDLRLALNQAMPAKTTTAPISQDAFFIPFSFLVIREQPSIFLR
jgi:hypothetical protein